MHCVAVGCSNRSPRDSNRGISFHRLPLKDKGLLSKWLAQIKRENLPQMKHCHVCSEHFEPTCFESEYRLDILPNNLSRRRLKEDAVPTLFQHTKKLSQRPESLCNFHLRLDTRLVLLSLHKQGLLFSRISPVCHVPTK